MAFSVITQQVRTMGSIAQGIGDALTWVPVNLDSLIWELNVLVGMVSGTGGDMCAVKERLCNLRDEFEGRKDVGLGM